MDLGRIKRKAKNHRKTVLLTIRVTPDISNWLREKEYSPTGIFYESLKELGYEEKNE